MNEPKTIPLFKVHMPKSVDEAVLQVLHSGYIGQGPQVDAFEKKLQGYFDHPYVLSLNSGTAGLHLALRLAGVGESGRVDEDEVITSAMTCTASNMPILERRGKIVWADVDPVSGLISPRDIEKKITPKTRAILVVHFGGITCDLEAIHQIAQKNSIPVIEDAAHAFGSTYQNRRIGSHSDYVMFSLQAIKHINTIDGGLLLTKSQQSYDRGKLLRWYGIDRQQKRSDFRCEENIQEYGYKFHMNDVCATIGIEQLKHIDHIVRAHRAHQAIYDREFEGLPGIRLIPKEIKQGSSAWLYTMHVEDRRAFMEFMNERQIMTSRVHERNDLHDAFHPFRKSLPGLDQFNATQVSIPVGWWLEEKDLHRIVDAVKSFCRKPAQRE